MYGSPEMLDYINHPRRCKKCGAVVTGKFCSECGAPVLGLHKPNKAKVKNFLLVFASFIFLLFAIGALLNQTGVSAENTPEDKPSVTLAGFNAIGTGMVYSDVCKIFNSDGTLLSSADLGGGSKTEIYYWTADGNSGANCNITFQNGRVIAKAQLGLQ